MSTFLKFQVSSFRRVPNPYMKSSVGDPNPEMFIAVCDVKDLPDNIPMGTNPREQKLTTAVPKKIKASLLDETNLDFYLLNRGLLLSVASVSFKNSSKELTLEFSNEDYHGNIDGGHTYKIIKEFRDQLDKGKQFVKIEIVKGIEDIFQRLAAARNTSTQVQDKSIAELEGRFDLIKDVISGTPYADDIFFRENEDGRIDVADILSILYMFNLDMYPNDNNTKFPTSSYCSKKKCIDTYIKYHKECGNKPINPYVKMQPIVQDIFRLYDHIEKNMGKYYREQNPAGKYGLTKGVVTAKIGKPCKSKFYECDMDYQTPAGFIYPVLGAFRALLTENPENNKYEWVKDPIAVANMIGGDLVNTTVECSRSLGNNPQSVGKYTGNWKTLYQSVKLS